MNDHSGARADTRARTRGRDPPAARGDVLRAVGIFCLTAALLSTVQGVGQADRPVHTVHAAQDVQLSHPAAAGPHPIVFADLGTGNKVLAIDPVAGTIDARIQVGNAPESTILSPGGRFVYVMDLSDPNVTVINTSTDTVAASVTVGSFPYDASFVSGGNVWTAIDSDPNVTVFNPTTFSVVRTLNLGASYAAFVTPNGTHAYLPIYGRNQVDDINTSTYAATTIHVGGDPYAGFLTKNGSYLYVVNYNTTNVSVIRTSTDTVVATLGPTVGCAGVITSSPNGRYFFIPSECHSGTAGSINVVDTATNTLYTVALSGYGSLSSVAGQLAPAPNSTWVYAAIRNTDLVYGINVTTRTVAATINVSGITPNGTRNFEVDVPGTDRLLVEDGHSQQYLLINTTDNQAVGKIVTGGTVDGNNKWAILTSPGTPSPPSNTTVTQGGSCSSVEISWTVPPPPAGENVTNETLFVYTTAGQLVQEIQILGDAGHVLVFDLACGVTYQFVVEIWLSGVGAVLGNGVLFTTASIPGTGGAALQCSTGIPVWLWALIGLLLLIILVLILISIESNRHRGGYQRGARRRR